MEVFHCKLSCQGKGWSEGPPQLSMTWCALLQFMYCLWFHYLWGSSWNLGSYFRYSCVNRGHREFKQNKDF